MRNKNGSHTVRSFGLLFLFGAFDHFGLLHLEFGGAVLRAFVVSALHHFHHVLVRLRLLRQEIAVRLNFALKVDQLILNTRIPHHKRVHE